MYRKIYLIAMVLSFSLFSNKVYAQRAGKVSLQSVEENTEWQVITLQNNQPFIIGANRYVLYIGDQAFFKSMYPDGDESSIQFYLTQEEFARLENGVTIRLSYGLIRENTDGLPDFSSPNPILYEIGNWNK